MNKQDPASIDQIINDNEILKILLQLEFNQTKTTKFFFDKYSKYNFSLWIIRTFIENRLKKSELISPVYKKYKESKKERDFQAIHPMVKKQFIRGIDKDLKFEDLTKGTHTNALFLCLKCDSQFPSTVKNLHRTVTGSKTEGYTGCPFCSGRQVNEKNSFGVRYPEYIPYWDYEKNTKSPYEVTPGLDKKFWFKCGKGHSFDAALCNITHNHKPRWCPKCTLRGTSYLEIVVYWELKSIFGELVLWQKMSSEGSDRYGTECDVLIDFPKQVVCIEVDGGHHKTKKALIRDKKKNALLKEQGVKIVRLRLEGLEKLSKWDINHSEKQSHKSILDRLIVSIEKIAPEVVSHHQVSEYLESNVLRNFKEIRKCHMSLLEKDEYIVCFLEEFPSLEEYWDVQKNLPYKPHLFSKGSHFLAHWKCPKCKSEDNITIKGMVTRNNPCTSCWEKERKLVDYERSIVNVMPKLLESWDSEKNEKLGLDPSTLSPWTKVDAYWICSFGHHHFSQIKVVADSVKEGYPGCKECKYSRTLTDIDGTIVSVNQLVKRIKEESGQENVSLAKAIDLSELGLDASCIRAYSKLSWAEKLDLSLSKDRNPSIDFKMYLRRLIYSVISQKAKPLDEVYKNAIEQCEGNVSKAEELLGLRPSKISDYYRKLDMKNPSQEQRAKLSVDDIKRLLERLSVRSHTPFLALLLMLACELSITKVLSLKHQDIDYTTGSIIKVGSKTKIPLKLLRVLKKNEDESCEYVFLTSTGAQLTSNQVNRSISYAAKKVGIRSKIFIRDFSPFASIVSDLGFFK